MLSRVHWVRPEMVVEVSYVEWTPDGLLRHSAFLRMRDDKRPDECIRQGRGPTRSGFTAEDAEATQRTPEDSGHPPASSAPCPLLRASAQGTIGAFPRARGGSFRAG